jgi:putative hemolysin
MNFPELSREGDPAYSSATERVAVARGEKRRRAAHADAAIGTSAAHETTCLENEATVELESREARKQRGNCVSPERSHSSAPPLNRLTTRRPAMALLSETVAAAHGRAT